MKQLSITQNKKIISKEIAERIKKAKQYRDISKDSEFMYFLDIAKGNKESINAIVGFNEYHILFEAFRFSENAEQFEELVKAGKQSLISMMEKHATEGIDDLFHRFSIWWIRQGILKNISAINKFETLTIEELEQFIIELLNEDFTTSKKNTELELAMAIRAKRLNDEFEYNDEQMHKLRLVNNTFGKVMRKLMDKITELKEIPSFITALISCDIFIQEQRLDEFYSNLFGYKNFHIASYSPLTKFNEKHFLQPHVCWNHGCFAHKAFENEHIWYPTYLFANNPFISLSDVCILAKAERDIKHLDDIVIDGTIFIELLHMGDISLDK